MRHPCSIVAALAAIILAPVLVAPALAAPAPAKRHAAPHSEPTAPAGPTEIGKFGDWTAARYVHAGQTICYAFVRAKSAHEAEPSASAPLLTVTERPTSRDEVAITTHAAYPKGATVTVQVGQTGLDFYTSGSDAFARDGKAAAAALRRGGLAIARGPGPQAATSTDTFSLAGFSAAYEAIVKACPAPK